MPSAALPNLSTRKRRCSLDDQTLTSNYQQPQRERCAKIRRLSINAPPTLSPFITFSRPVDTNSSLQPNCINETPLSNPTMTSSHTEQYHTRSEIFSNVNICHSTYWKPEHCLLVNHKRGRSFEQENIPTHHSTCMINSPHFLNLDIPHYRLSHLNLFQHIQKKRKPPLLDLSQILGKLCIVDEVDESTSAVGL